MYRILFLATVAVVSGNSSAVQIVPVDANADAVHVSAITTEIELQPDAVTAWDRDATVDIESQSLTENPVVYMIPNEVGTPSPLENHELDREQIQVSERRFTSLVMVGVICFVSLVCLIVKFSI